MSQILDSLRAMPLDGTLFLLATYALVFAGGVLIALLLTRQPRDRSLRIPRHRRF